MLTIVVDFVVKTVVHGDFSTCLFIDLFHELKELWSVRGVVAIIACHEQVRVYHFVLESSVRSIYVSKECYKYQERINQICPRPEHKKRLTQPN